VEDEGRAARGVPNTPAAHAGIRARERLGELFIVRGEMVGTNLELAGKWNDRGCC
jgi:hypothetical protein